MTDDDPTTGLAPGAAERMARMEADYLAQAKREAELTKARTFALNSLGLVLSTGWLAGTVWLVAQAVEYIR